MMVTISIAGHPGEKVSEILRQEIDRHCQWFLGLPKQMREYYRKHRDEARLASDSYCHDGEKARIAFGKHVK